jgi:ABC-type glycerol-3-phosphate transport system substrate-binding protein
METHARTYVKVGRRTFLTLAAGAGIAAAGGLSMLRAGEAQAGSLRVGSESWVYKKFNLKEWGTKFGAAHKVGTKFETLPDNDISPELLSWPKGRTEWDLIVVGLPLFIAPLAGQNLLVDMTDFIKGYGEDKFVPTFLRDIKFARGNGWYWPMVPFLGELIGVQINTKLYRAAGLIDAKGAPQPIPAWDLDAMVDYFRKLSVVSPLKAGLGLDWDSEFGLHNYLAPLLGARGTIYSKSDPRMIDLESPEAVKVLTLFSRLQKEKLLFGDIAPTASGSALTNFKAGLVPAHATTVSRAIESAANLGAENVSWILWPGADKHGSITYTHNAFIPKVSPNQKLAADFIREQVLSLPAQVWTFNNFGKLPSQREAYKHVKWFQKEAEATLEVASISTFEPKYKGIAQLGELFTKETQQSIVKGTDPAEALANIRKGIAAQHIDLTLLGYSG